MLIKCNYSLLWAFIICRSVGWHAFLRLFCTCIQTMDKTKWSQRLFRKGAHLFYSVLFGCPFTLFLLARIISHRQTDKDIFHRDRQNDISQALLSWVDFSTITKLDVKSIQYYMLMYIRSSGSACFLFSFFSLAYLVFLSLLLLVLFAFAQVPFSRSKQ